ncbi:protein LDOC1 [Spea bombifrons]|uniref:protein LDOC1 n=1 Tax=Spea bombifrons TaxID=233779 RepID=UPI00234AB3F0|nr:protein LDOC1 [Spea bombifrons]
MDQLFRSQEARMQGLDHRMDQLAQALQTLLTRTDPVSGTAAPPVNPQVTTPPAATIPLRLPSPPRYGGDPTTCRGFLNQCAIQFELMPYMFPSDRARVGYMISLLTDRALAWASPLWQKESPLINDYRDFVATMQRIFDMPGREATASASLMSLQQGSRSLSDYAIEFRTIAAELGWNNEALVAAFMHGLSDKLKDELAAREMPEDLEDLILFISRIDLRLRQRQSQKEKQRKPPIRLAPRFSNSTPQSLDPEEPMQLGATSLTEQEKSHRRSEGLCLYCGGRGHFARYCPNKPGNART